MITSWPPCPISRRFPSKVARIEGTWSPNISLIELLENRVEADDQRRYKARYKFIDTLVRRESWLFLIQSLFDLCTMEHDRDKSYDEWNNLALLSRALAWHGLYFLSCVNYLFVHIHIYIYIFTSINIRWMYYFCIYILFFSSSFLFLHFQYCTLYLSYFN